MEFLPSSFQGVRFRRSRHSDAQALAEIMGLRDISPEGIPDRQLFGVATAKEFIDLIETSWLCVTAVSEEVNTDTNTRKILGCVAFSNTPRAKGFPGSHWEDLLRGGLYASQSPAVSLDDIVPCNTLWLTMLLAPPASLQITGAREEDNPGLYRLETALLASSYSAVALASELITIALGINHRTQFVLSAVLGDTDDFPLLTELETSAIVRGLSKDSSPIDLTFDGNIYSWQRSQFITALGLRRGRVEDYDDFVPLLLRGRGVITDLPEDFFLDEILMEQDHAHKVVIAENPTTHQVVGLASLRALTGEEQQSLTRLYSTDIHNKLRSIGLDEVVQQARAATAAEGKAFSNTFHVDFLYFNPDYDFSAYEFVEYMFEQFPMCEFASIILPHSISEPPILKPFHYIPIRKYQPHNAKGESVRVPDGLWVACRFDLKTLEARPNYTREEREMCNEFLGRTQLSGLTNETHDRFKEDALLSFEREGIEELDYAGLLPTTTTFRLTWRSEVAGVASARRLSLEDMYALRANYDLDAYIYFNTRTPKNYKETNINLSAEGGRRQFLSPDMPGVVIRCMYVRPCFQSHISFFVAEIVRQYGVEVAVALTSADDDPFCPLLHTMLPARPRRVLEKPKPSEKDLEREKRLTAATAAASGGAEKSVYDLEDEVDIAALGVLFVTSRRCLGDPKIRIHTRITVVGASSTALAFFHRLLCIPHIHFSNLLVVSTDGLPDHPNQQEFQWKVDTAELLEREHMCLRVGRGLRTVTGTMVDLDKVNKFVAVDNGTFEPYDFLVLCSGRQYVTPTSIRALQQQEGKGSRSGVVPLSGDHAVERLRQKLVAIDQNTSNISNVLVYGSNMDVFAITTSMIQLGFSAQRIAICSPSETMDFMDDSCYQAAVTYWRALGVNCWRGYDVARLEYEDTNLSTVVLAPVSHESGASQSVELACSLIVAAEDKDIDSNVLSTLNKRSIVFDGRVIVENNYQTADPFIFAAGPVAMFTRRYGRTQNFEVFNARDVGSHLAEVLLGYMGFDEFIDPKFHHENIMTAINNDTGKTLYTKVLEDNGSRNVSARGPQQDGGAADLQGMEGMTIVEIQKNLPTYTTPLRRRLRFPGGFMFFAILCVNFIARRCAKLDCSNLDLDNPETAMKFAVGTADDEENRLPEQNLINIYVNERNRKIDSVSFFGNDHPEFYNYAALVGYPESVINLVFRYREAQQRVQEERVRNYEGSGLTAGALNGKLNLMEYLRLPHLQTVFYDRFAVFFEQLNEKMRQHERAMELRQRVLDEHRLDSSIPPETFDAYQKELTRTRNDFKFQVQLELIQFLHNNKDFRSQNLYLPNIEKQINKQASK